ncbi:unnamed protein product [Prorocentrum cordatum]|uniref:Elongation of fatty acids protein n=1 Tax=Prorocentrum cordatum TaxID=2364126 RepID=A0ABN9PLH0_9DINO|nr:unnamed protein product [Polarella glacialis]
MTVAYLFGVGAGIRVMEKRPPVQRRIFEFMFIYNVTLVMLNASLSFTLWKEAWDLGFPYPWGNGLDFSERGHRLGMLLWFEYHGRQLELLDTLFVILRKKFYRMSLLHIALRLSHMWGWFFCCRHACGGDSYFPAAVNCTCQALVYSYYSLSLLDSPGIPPVLLKRARVTEVQISRLMLCSAHALYVLIQGNLPRAIAAASLCIMGCSLLLYIDFDGQGSEDRAGRARGGARRCGFATAGPSPVYRRCLPDSRPMSPPPCQSPLIVALQAGSTCTTGGLQPGSRNTSYRRASRRRTTFRATSTQRPSPSAAPVGRGTLHGPASCSSSSSSPPLPPGHHPHHHHDHPHHQNHHHQHHQQHHHSHHQQHHDQPKYHLSHLHHHRQHRHQRQNHHLQQHRHHHHEHHHQHHQYHHYRIQHRQHQYPHHCLPCCPSSWSP